MKDKILTALKAKFTGVNANILDRIAGMLAKTVTTEDQVSTAVEGVTKDFIDVVEGYGDSRATDAQKTAVANYERKHGLKDGEKVTEPAKTEEHNTTEQNASTPAWAQALIDSNKQLTERLNKMEGERTATNRKAELDGIISKLPESMRKGYARISLEGTDDEWTTLKGQIQTEVEAICKETGAKSAVFGRPTGGGTIATSSQQQEASSEEVNAVVGKLNI